MVFAKAGRLLLPLLLGGIASGCPGSPREGAGEKPAVAGQGGRNAVTIPQFSGDRAYAFLERQTSLGPRNPNSAGHEQCMIYLQTTLQGLADEVRPQPFTHTGYNGEGLRLTNIIASFRPEEKNRILLCAHWDTRPRADQDTDLSRRDEPILGANDGASGVAVLLEIATLLKQERPRIGVDIVLFDGEDYGMEGDHLNYLLGSRYYALNKPTDYVPRFGILLDMVGDTYLEIPKEGYSLRYAPDLVDLVWSTARQLGISQFVDIDGEEIIDDHLPLNEVGIKTIDLIDFNYPDGTNKFWHTHEDVPAHCSPTSLGAVGTVLTQLLYTQSP